VKKKLPTLLLLCLGAALLCAGILAGQPREVMTKAVRICMECVGLG